MKDIRYVCQTPQGKYCGNSSCPLAYKCSIFSVFRIPFRYQHTKKNKRNGISKTETEKTAHQKAYVFYNMIFGDLKTKKIIYNKKYYLQHKEQILRSKKRTVDYHLTAVQKCEYDCFHCPYDDCKIPIPKTRKEYMDLYYQINHKKLLKQKNEYRENHREYLRNSEKIRNYIKKGYIMSQCILISTNHPNYEKYIGTQGTLSIIPINKKDYVRFISLDCQYSFRFKIDKRLNDLNNPLCTEVYYSDFDGYEYTFKSTVNPGNPLWEMEHNNNFVRNNND